MRRKTLLMGLMVATMAITPMVQISNVYAEELTQSARWEGSENTWRVSDNNGGYLKNCWFQDDITKDWYLLGADDGSVMFSGLVTDQATGKTYLLNPNHDGTFGKMLTADGTYNINGKEVYLTFNQEHNGTYGAIISGLSEVRNTGITEKQLASIPSDNQAVTPVETSDTYNENDTVDMTRWDMNRDGIISESEQARYESWKNSSLTPEEAKWDTDFDGVLNDRERAHYEAMKDFDYDEWTREHGGTGGKLDWNV